MSDLTITNHYVPCFWSALWNEGYYHLKVSNQKALKPREQSLYVLNIKSNTIYKSKTSKLFYEEKLGHIPITRAEYLELTAQDKTLSLAPEILYDHNALLIMDIENHFTDTEEVIGYDYIIKIMQNVKVLENYDDKVKVSAFLFYHPFRSARYLKSLYEKYSEHENFRFLALYEWKYLRDKITHTWVITDIFEGEWTVYSVCDFLFPICDNPIINRGNEIFAIISPKHLIKINIRKKSNKIFYRNKIGCLEYRRLIRNIIENTDSVIANGDKLLLEKIKKLKVWQRTLKE